MRPVRGLLLCWMNLRSENSPVLASGRPIRFQTAIEAQEQFTGIVDAHGKKSIAAIW
jgi:hypothetical protein